MKEYSFTVVTEDDEAGKFIAICPALPGCYTWGNSLEEARVHIKDAIRLHIECWLKEGDRIPEEVLVESVQVAV